MIFIFFFFSSGRRMRMCALVTVVLSCVLTFSGSGVGITGSNNPSNYNGFKIMRDGRTQHGSDIQKLAQIMAQPESLDGIQPGNSTPLDLLDAYGIGRASCRERVCQYV